MIVNTFSGCLFMKAKSSLKAKMVAFNKVWLVGKIATAQAGYVARTI